MNICGWYGWHLVGLLVAMCVPAAAGFGAMFWRRPDHMEPDHDPPHDERDDG